MPPKDAADRDPSAHYPALSNSAAARVIKQRSVSEPAPTSGADKTVSLAGRVAAELERLQRPVILVGLMGSGKSLMGQKLANALGCDFVDSDAEVEAAAGMTVRHIFENLGEAAFRDGERRVIARLLESKPGVIALGGGAFEDATTRSACLEKGICVWLDVDIDTLVKRVSGNRKRPLLQHGDPKAILSALYEKRKPAYAEAPIRFAASRYSQRRNRTMLLHRLEQYLHRSAKLLEGPVF